MITFSANIRSASATTDDAITTSSVGIPVTLDLSADFDGLAKTLCFKTPSAAVDIALVGDATESTVPPDVLINSGEWLHIGIYAADANGDIVIPTVWANAGVIQLGTLPSGVDPSAPTPSWVAQVQQMAGDALNNSAQAIDTANEAKEVAITAQDSAQASAAAAAQSATEAASAEVAAANSAGDAAASATAASGSAQTATEKASEAAASAAAAGTASATATEKAGEAAQSANSAAQSATTAQESAQAAQSAQTAAAGSASTASQKASEAAQSATQAGDSASAASASATAAGNAQMAAETAQEAAENAQSAAEQAADDAAEYADRLINVYPTDTASGSIATFSDGADDVPVKSLVVNIAPVQSGTGDPSPENVRPISGWDAVDVSVANANLIAEYSEHPLAVSDDGYIYRNTIGTSVLFRCRAGVTYHVLRGEGANREVWGFFAEKPVPGVSHTAAAVLNVTSVVAPITGWCVLFIRSSVYDDGIAKGTQVSLFPPTDVSLPDTTDATVDLGQTVYGGTLDVTSGTLTADTVIRSISAMNRTNNHNFYISTSSWGHRPLQQLHTVDGIICDRLPTIPTPPSSSAAVDGCYTDSARAFIVRTAEAYATASEMFAALGGQINICYKTEPFVVAQLTPTEVNSFLGTNNIWADTGDVDVTYRADVQLYINQKTAQTLTAAASMLSNVETDMTATRAYAVNDFLSVNGQLYRVTASIANGATITPGTNVTKTTVGAQITALLNA